MNTCHRAAILRLASIFVVLTCSLPAASAQPAALAAKVKPAAIHISPKGWNSWNSFANLIDAKIAMAQAQALVDTGMKNAGYQYVTIDEGWWQGERDANGNIVVDPERWPALKPGEKAGDMANIARYIHSLGLKAGIYTDAGEFGCGMYPDLGPKYPHTGAYGHYEQDFLQFSKWGFDYVKVDWCGGADAKLIGSLQYAEIARAIRRAERITGRPLYFSICEWGSQQPWTWAAGVGGVDSTIWRTGGDIVAPVIESATDADHLKRVVTLKNVFDSYDAGVHPEGQHTGYYNDLDMMVIGMRGIKEPWERIHMGLWALHSAPLNVGADLTHLSKASLAILNNAEVLAVHDDVLGVQAIKVAEPQPGLQVWARPLAGAGKRAVVLLNRTETPAPITLEWAKLGLAGNSASARDLFAQRDLGNLNAGYTATVPAQDLVMLVVTGEEKEAAFQSAASPENVLIGGAVAAACPECPEGKSVTIGGNKVLSVKGMKSAANQGYLRVIYRNRSKAPIVGNVSVNGGAVTGVAFPPTGEELRAITVEVKLQGNGAPNFFEFSAPSGEEVALAGVSLSAW